MNKIKDKLTDNQKEMMQGFMQMMNMAWGKENCEKWYSEFLEKDESFLEENKKRVQEILGEKEQ